MRRIRTRTCLALLACVACGLVAAPALATYHLTKIREISGSSSDQANIELQMYQPGQNLVSGHNLTFWDADAQGARHANSGANHPSQRPQPTE